MNGRRSSSGRDILSWVRESPNSPRRSLGASLGRPFVGPVFDTLLIGGGLSLPVLAVVLAGPDAPWVGGVAAQLNRLTGPGALPWVVLLCSATHFSASTVRLYTKPGTTTSLPFLTMAFPLVSLALLTLCILEADSLGHHLRSLYFTWSPYHFAAQAYGLTVMYCYRSGCGLGDRDKKWLRWVSLLPFFYSFISSGAGLFWLLPEDVYQSPGVSAVLAPLRPTLVVAGMLGPLALYAWVRRRGRTPMPLIGPLVLLANGIWWFFLPVREAFVWATFFHGIQYLAIVIIFHVREQMAREDNRHGRLYHVVWFYGVSVALAYGLFSCLPQAYSFVGFSLTESLLLVVAAIVIHHFIVDAFIWRLGRQDANRAVVDSGVLLATEGGT